MHILKQIYSCWGPCAVCVVHKQASGWHPFLLLPHTASLPHWPCLLLAAGFPWQPQSVHTAPLSLAFSLSIPLSLPKPGHTCILPFPDSPIHQHKAEPCLVLAFYMVCVSLWVCLWLEWTPNLSLWRLFTLSSKQPKIIHISSKGKECNV